MNARLKRYINNRFIEADMSGKKLPAIPKMPRKNVKQTRHDKNRQIIRLVIELDRELDGVDLPASASAIVNALRELAR